MKGGAGEIVTQLRNDTATQKNAATGTEGERKVGGGRAQNGAENIKRAQAVWAVVLKGAVADVGRRQHFGVEPGLARQAAVDELQAGARQEPFSRDMAIDFARFFP